MVPQSDPAPILSEITNFPNGVLLLPGSLPKPYFEVETGKVASTFPLLLWTDISWEAMEITIFGMGRCCAKIGACQG